MDKLRQFQLYHVTINYQIGDNQVILNNMLQF